MLINTRWAAATMKDQGLDALVATSAESVMYLSDYECLTHWINKGAQIYATVFPEAGDELAGSLIAPMLEVEAIVESGVWMRNIFLVGEFWRSYPHGGTLDEVPHAARELIDRAPNVGSAVQGLVADLEARGLKRGRVGIEKSGLSPTAMAELRRRLPNVEFVSADETIWQIRMVKSPEEVQRLRTAAEVTEAGMIQALGTAAPGVSERDIIRDFHRALVLSDAKPAFTCFGSGSRSAYPHILPRDKSLQQGDVLRYDIGCTYEYYYSDTARSMVLGAPTEFQQHVWDAMVEGEEAAIALARPGADPAHLYQAAMAPGKKAGLSDFMRVHCGHGIGINVYDPPLVMESDPEKSVYTMPGADEGLVENMVINIETGYYVQGVGGFQCEDTLLVTADGHELLTHASKDLSLEKYLAAKSEAGRVVG